MFKVKNLVDNNGTIKNQKDFVLEQLNTLKEILRNSTSDNQIFYIGITKFVKANAEKEKVFSTEELNKILKDYPEIKTALNTHTSYHETIKKDKEPEKSFSMSIGRDM